MRLKKSNVSWHKPVQGSSHYGEHGTLPVVRATERGLSISTEAYQQMGSPEYVMVGMVAPSQLVMAGVKGKEEGSWKCTQIGKWKGRIVGGYRMLPWIQSHFSFVKEGQSFLMEWDDDYDAWALDLKCPLEEGEDDGEGV